MEASATGTVIANDQPRGFLLVPSYNVREVPSDQYFRLARAFAGPLRMADGGTFNFLWTPFDVRAFARAHAPYSQGFQEAHGVPLMAALAVIAALLLRVMYLWREGQERVIRYIQRAYEGPYTWEYIVEETSTFLQSGLKWLNVTGVEKTDVERTLRLLTLPPDRTPIDLLLGGPPALILPVAENRFFLDYAWLYETFYTMFYGITLTNENFKGDALEEAVRREGAPLTHKRLKAVDGQQRQIDAAFAVGGTLVIAECRAFGRSLAVDRGDPKAIRYRTTRVDAALSAVDEKARWLRERPIGRNYDISRFDRIVPMAVTPFVEFIPSLDRWYWLAPELPRVLTPAELAEALDEGTLGERIWNAVERGTIHQS
jgi:hypothetical protein